MMARKSKPAPTPVPQTRQEFETLAVQLGEGMRALGAAADGASNEIARVKLALKNDTAELEKRIEAQWEALAAYATAHRAELLPDNRKSVSIAAGIIGWRLSTPSVKLTDEDEVIDAIEALGFVQFLREKTEIDKVALLAQPELAAKIDGVTIRQVENLFFQPLDLEAEKTKSLKTAPAAVAEAA
jgi:phage host-nuclease inhibitor protein Gam